MHQPQWHRGHPRHPGVPRLGAGLGGLAWPDVGEVLRRAGEDITVELIAVSLSERA